MFCPELTFGVRTDRESHRAYSVKWDVACLSSLLPSTTSPSSPSSLLSYFFPIIHSYRHLLSYLLTWKENHTKLQETKGFCRKIQNTSILISLLYLWFLMQLHGFVFWTISEVLRPWERLRFKEKNKTKRQQK